MLGNTLAGVQRWCRSKPSSLAWPLRHILAATTLCYLLPFSANWSQSFMRSGTGNGNHVVCLPAAPQ